VEKFADAWETQVLRHQKPSSVKAAKSHLKTYIRNHLGKVLLHELSPQIQQNFVTLLSQRVSRKTVLNVLGTLSSMMRTAKSWGYCTRAVTTSELALPSDQIRKQTRFFNWEEARKIITIASEPYRTMFAIAAMSGLRVGEIVGLQKADLDLDRRIIQVQRSAWYGRIQTVKSKASRAPVAMAEALATLLKEYLATWQTNSEGDSQRDAVDKVGEILRPSAPKSEKSGE
jgi:integrase